MTLPGRTAVPVDSAVIPVGTRGGQPLMIPSPDESHVCDGDNPAVVHAGPTPSRTARPQGDQPLDQRGWALSAATGSPYDVDVSVKREDLHLRATAQAVDDERRTP